MNHAWHTFYISYVYKVNSLQHSVFATTPSGWCIGLALIGPRGIGMTLRFDVSAPYLVTRGAWNFLFLKSP